MAEIWPLTLPVDILRAGFKQQAQPTTIRTSIEAGLDKVRRRYTVPIVDSTVSMLIDFDQYLILEDFYNITLQGGVLTFLFTDPAVNVEYEYSMLAPPAYSAVGGTYYTASMQWERIT